ncbi:MAG: Ycf66 family protein [Thainema sp.]
MGFGTPVPLLLGIIMIVGAVALFFLNRLKPGYERDIDKIYAFAFLIAGIILLTEWDMSFPAAMQQLIVVLSLISLTIQNIYSRTPLDPRVAPPVGGYDGGRDDYRPPSRPDYRPGPRTNVRAELDRRDYMPDDRYYANRPMIGGREEPYYDDYRGAPPDAYSSYRPGTPPNNGVIGRLPGNMPDRSERGMRPSRSDSRDRTPDRPYNQPPSSYTQQPPADPYSSRPPANNERWNDWNDRPARPSSRPLGNRPSSLDDARRSPAPTRTAARFDAHDPAATNQDEPMAPSNYVDYSAVNPDDRPDQPLNLS